MPEKEEPMEKHYQIREFGDSLYVPLTKFLKAIGLDKNKVAKVVLVHKDDQKKIEITNPEDK